MAKKSKLTFQKREKERARLQKQRDKEAQRLQVKERRANAGPRLEGEDPDLAGIRPGPQALPEHWDYVGDRSSDSAEEAQDGIDKV